MKNDNDKGNSFCLLKCEKNKTKQKKKNHSFPQMLRSQKTVFYVKWGKEWERNPVNPDLGEENLLFSP